MSEPFPLCPECSSEHASDMGALRVCPMCGHEWALGSGGGAAAAGLCRENRLRGCPA